MCFYVAIVKQFPSALIPSETSSSLNSDLSSGIEQYSSKHHILESLHVPCLTPQGKACELVKTLMLPIRTVKGVFVWAVLEFVVQTLQHCIAGSKKQQFIAQAVVFLLAIPCSAKALNKHLKEREMSVQEVSIYNIYLCCYSLSTISRIALEGAVCSVAWLYFDSTAINTGLERMTQF